MNKDEHLKHIALKRRIRKLKEWAQFWSVAPATNDKDKGWQFAAKEVLHLLNTPSGEKEHG